MGTWNVGIFQNDIAEDVKIEYIELLRDGLDAKKADEKMIDIYREIIEMNDSDTVDFYLSLALIEWQYGRLQSNTKEKALYYATNNEYLKNWELEGKSILAKRKQVLNEFVITINSIQPNEKKIKIIKPFNCIWNIGDIFAYQLNSNKSKDYGVYGKYIVFQKTAESESYPKKIVPIIRVACKIYEIIPNMDDYLNEKKIIWFGTPKDYQEGKLIIYNDSFLYDKKMYVKSIKSYPDCLTFIGNSYPIKKEYREAKIIGENYDEWKNFEESYFEFYDKWKDVDEKNIKLK